MNYFKIISFNLQCTEYSAIITLCVHVFLHSTLEMEITTKQLRLGETGLQGVLHALLKV